MSNQAGKLKVLSVFGTRPEAIKMAPVLRELARYPSLIESIVCVTAQHRDMLDQVLAAFEIRTDHDLDLMSANQTPTSVASAVLDRLEKTLNQERPDWMLVQGDTTTTMSAALAAFHARVKVGHIEAGLRTGDRQAPFPEEINRRIVTTVADLHFAPTESARQNLLREAVSDDAIVVTGNPVIDALHWIVSREYTPGAALAALSSDSRIILVTAHRRESFGRPIKEICLAIRDIAALYSDVHVVYAVHRNPNVWDPAHWILGNAPRVTLLAPLAYQPFSYLLRRAYLVLTDSGGLQEEAPALGKPVLVLRDVTERPEGVAAGTVRMVGSNRRQIVENVRRLLDDRTEYSAMAHATNPYGDGKAAGRIVRALLEAAGLVEHVTPVSATLDRSF